MKPRTLLFTALTISSWGTNPEMRRWRTCPWTSISLRKVPIPLLQQLAWSGALLITLTILALSIFARIVVSALQPARRT